MPIASAFRFVGISLRAFDQSMEDVSGSTAIRLLADILGNRPHIGQLAGGTVNAPRYADFERGV